jgi:pyruvate,water dikinase
LAARHFLEHPDDVSLLTFHEMAQLVQSTTPAAASQWRQLLAERRQSLQRENSRPPPLIMTSTGEILHEPLPENLPPNALVGVAASAGQVEGRARVILDPAQQVLQADEILVYVFSLFLSFFLFLSSFDPL